MGLRLELRILSNVGWPACVPDPSTQEHGNGPQEIRQTKRKAELRQGRGHKIRGLVSRLSACCIYLAIHLHGMGRLALSYKTACATRKLQSRSNIYFIILAADISEQHCIFFCGVDLLLTIFSIFRCPRSVSSIFCTFRVQCFDPARVSAVLTRLKLGDGPKPETLKP